MFDNLIKSYVDDDDIRTVVDTIQTNVLFITSTINILIFKLYSLNAAV
jgi:hypothetical protein